MIWFLFSLQVYLLWGITKPYCSQYFILKCYDSTEANAGMHVQHYVEPDLHIAIQYSDPWNISVMQIGPNENERKSQKKNIVQISRFLPLYNKWAIIENLMYLNVNFAVVNNAIFFACQAQNIQCMGNTIQHLSKIKTLE